MHRVFDLADIKSRSQIVFASPSFPQSHFQLLATRNMRWRMRANFILNAAPVEIASFTVTLKFLFAARKLFWLE